MIFKSKYRKAVFIVTYTLRNNELLYVIQKRKLHWKGWEFPKGKIEFLETKKHATRREAEEETGLKVLKIKNHHKKGKYLYEKKLRDRPGIIGQTYHLYSAKVKYGKLKMDKKEHYFGKWASYKEAIKKITHKEQKDCLKMVHKFLTK